MTRSQKVWVKTLKRIGYDRTYTYDVDDHVVIRMKKGDTTRFIYPRGISDQKPE